MIRQASAWMLALLLGVATAFAQQGTTEVRGRVLDPQGAMLPGVTVTVRNQDTGMFRETVSGHGRHLHRRRHRAGTIRAQCRAAGLQEVPAP